MAESDSLLIDQLNDVSKNDSDDINKGDVQKPEEKVANNDQEETLQACMEEPKVENEDTLKFSPENFPTVMTNRDTDEQEELHPHHNTNMAVCTQATTEHMKVCLDSSSPYYTHTGLNNQNVNATLYANNCSTTSPAGSPTSPPPVPPDVIPIQDSAAIIQNHNNYYTSNPMPVTKVLQVDSSTNTCSEISDHNLNKQCTGNENHEMSRPDSRTSLATTVDMEVCRICHCESYPEAPLISPCVCSGSLKFVHQSCLQQWVKSADTKSCELCKFNFTMTSKIKPLRKWQKLEMTTIERRKIMCSVTFHVIAITCVIWSLYVLIDKTTEEMKLGILEWPFWTKLIVVGIGFTGGLVFMYVQCKMYLKYCRKWRAYNRVVYIQHLPDVRSAMNKDKGMQFQPMYAQTKLQNNSSINCTTASLSADTELL